MIPFNKPFLTGRELEYIAQAHANAHLSGDGPFTRKCQAWIREESGCGKALLTQSCTAALEMAALLAGIGPGDEVIMPSYTFVSTANAVVLRGGVPVFVDIRSDTLNIDEALIEAAITPQSRAITVVHYAGVACEMDPIMETARKHGLIVIEDAAQAIMSRYKERPLGSIGHLGAFSFQETKNLISGEGGALLVNDAKYHDRAEIIWEKGTNRQNFFRGLVDKYTWCDVGSSFLPSELTAAFLWAQLCEAAEIQRRRLALWNRYFEAFADLEEEGLVRRPVVPAHCQFNGHIFYLILPSRDARSGLIASLKAQNINAVFHYVPLHNSPAGLRLGRASADLPMTEELSERLVRLPLWVGLEDQIGRVIEAVRRFFISSDR